MLHGYDDAVCPSEIPSAGHERPSSVNGSRLTNNDQELLAACGAFDEIERHYLQASKALASDTASDDLSDELSIQAGAAQEPLLETICSLRASSIRGILGRVRTLMLHDEAMDPEQLLGSQYVNDRLLGALLRDLANLAERDRAEA